MKPSEKYRMATSLNVGGGGGATSDTGALSVDPFQPDGLRGTVADSGDQRERARSQVVCEREASVPPPESRRSTAQPTAPVQSR